MTTARISEYRSNLSLYHSRVLSDHEPLRIIGPSRGDVIVIAADDYDRLQASITVLKDRATLNSLLESGTDLSDSPGEEPVYMKDVFTDVMDSENK